jgi:hypothetical protein
MRRRPVIEVITRQPFDGSHCRPLAKFLGRLPVRVPLREQQRDARHGLGAGKRLRPHAAELRQGGVLDGVQLVEARTDNGMIVGIGWRALPAVEAQEFGAGRHRAVAILDQVGVDLGPEFGAVVVVRVGAFTAIGG